MSDSAPITGTAAGNQAGADAPASAGTPPAATQEASRFSQDQLNTLLAEEKRKWKQQHDEAARKVRQEAEEAAAAQRGEFEKLATERASRIAALETDLASRDARITALTEEIERQSKARLRALPEEIRAMAPEGDVLALYAWLGKAEAAAAKIGAPAPAGTPPGPRGSGAAPLQTGDDLVARKRASADYAA